MNARRARRRGSQAVRGAAPLPAWIWLLAGMALGIGLSAAFIVLDLAPGRSTEAPVAALPAEAPLAQEPEAQAPGRRPTPRYTFYTVLPEMEVVIPDAELGRQRRQEPIASDAAAPSLPAAGSERYLLQAGSFRDPRDADAVQAKLILLNFSPHVQTVAIDGTTWHRVRIGPFTSAREVDEAKRMLSANGIEAITLRESGG